MAIPETERELFSYLRAKTRELDVSDLSAFTTNGLSTSLQLSRNLTSHYLNELVRAGAVVKAGSRPVYYFSRRDLERVLQTPLERVVFATVEELLSQQATDEPKDFERVVGHDLSLASSIEKLKAAVAYPPHGLPVLMCGGKGVGKSMLAAAMVSYGKRKGALPQGTRSVTLDCAAYAQDHDGFIRALEPASQSLAGQPAADREARASGSLVLVLRDVDRLSAASQSYLVDRMQREVAGGLSIGTRLVLLATCSQEDPAVAAFVRAVPVVVQVPSLRERTAEEREELVLGLFKEQGRRLGVDVFVSRMAFSCLTDASFDDNVRGLSACITSCCAAAYLDHVSERLEIQAFLLPGSVLDAAVPSRSAAHGRMSEMDDAELIDTTRLLERRGESRSVRAFSAMLAAQSRYEQGALSGPELVREVMAQVRDYEDYLVFDFDSQSSRAASYERLLTQIVDEVNAVYGIDLSRKAARVLARCIHVQVHSGSRLAKWRASNQTELEGLLAALLETSEFSRFASERAGSLVESALGVRLDVLTRIVLFAVIHEADRRAGRRQSVGIVLSHGYSTASSIADAANRILRARVFEAIDMSYDQQVKDIIGPLRDLLDAYAFCKEVAILVDMGSLEHILEDVGQISNVTVGVVNNASTGVALEIGSGLLAGEPLQTLLPAATQACSNRYRIVEARVLEQALVFCSEGGAAAAERIRSLVEKSLETAVPLRLVACSRTQFQREGLAERYDVLAVIGTDDPGIAGVPFIGLEDLIAGEKSAGVDEVFSRFLSAPELERFHQNLVKSLTLRNVIESITILNPTKVLEEVEAAVESLQALMGTHLAAHTMIGLCVHLCCLIERLVTHNAIESYVDVKDFEASHQQFIDQFRQSFDDIAHHYHVEVPVTEIAYAYDYVHHKSNR